MNYKKSLLLNILFSTFVFVSTLNAQKTEIPAIVTIDWLEKNIDNVNLSIIDLRPKEEYSKSHIKNAVNVPGLKNLFDDKFFMPKLDFLKELFSKSGIDSDSLVLAYDNGEFIWASRFYWILETLGHKNVGILICGGNNDIIRMSEIKERALLFSKLKHYFIVRFPQRSGALKEFVNNVVGENDDITFFEYVKKNNREYTSAIVGIELKFSKDLDHLITKMKENGFFGEYLNDKPETLRFLI